MTMRSMIYNKDHSSSSIRHLACRISERGARTRTCSSCGQNWPSFLRMRFWLLSIRSITHWAWRISARGHSCPTCSSWACWVYQALVKYETCAYTLEQQHTAKVTSIIRTQWKRRRSTWLPHWPAWTCTISLIACSVMNEQ